MPTYSYTAPNGITYEIDGPPGATQDQVRQQVLLQHPNAAATSERPLPSASATAAPQKAPGFFEKAAEQVGAAARGFTSGAFLNADDEIVAALNTVMPLDKITNRDVTSVYEQMAKGLSPLDAVKAAYGHNVNIERTAIRRDEREAALARGVSQVAGGVAGAFVPVPKLGVVTRAGEVVRSAVAPVVETAARVAPRAVKTVEAARAATAPAARVAKNLAKTPVGVGAAQGAVSGFAAGEGDMQNRLASAEQGAVTGAASGAMLGTLFKAAPLIRSYWNAARGTVAPGEAMRVVADRLRRDGFDVATEEGQRALRDVLDSFGNKPVTLADVGNAIRARAGVGLRASGEGQRAGSALVEERAGEAGKRLEQDVQDFVSKNPNIYEADDLIVAKSAEAVDPLYKEAYARTLAYNDTLGDLLKRPSVRDALKDAARIAADAGEDATKLGFIVDSQGNVTGVNSPTLKTWDYVTRALRENAETHTNDHGKLNAKGQGLMDLRQQLLEQLDTMEPAFGEARNIWRGRERLRDALRFGREILTKSKTAPEASPERIAAQFGKMSALEQEMARMGAARKFVDDIRATPEGGDPTKAVLGNQLQRDRLQSFFTGKDVVPYGETPAGPAPASVPVSDLKARVGQEKQLGLLTKELPKRGERVTLEEQEGQPTPTMLNSATAWVGRLAQEALNKGSLARNEALNNELLPLLLQQDRKVIDETIRQLSQQGGRARAVADRLRRYQNAALRGVNVSVSSSTARRAPLDDLTAAYP